MLFAIRAVDKDRFQGDDAPIRLIADLLAEHDQALDIIRSKGLRIRLLEAVKMLEKP
jgi:hypothetical protein